MAAESTNEDAISNAPGPGTAIDRRFEVVAELGAGQSGTVYRARVLEAHDGLAAGSAVAIKVLRPELRNDPEAQKRLVEEGRLGLSLQSPHLVKIYSADPEAAALLGRRLAGAERRKAHEMLVRATALDGDVGHLSWLADQAFSAVRIDGELQINNVKRRYELAALASRLGGDPAIPRYLRQLLVDEGLSDTSLDALDARVDALLESVHEIQRAVHGEVRFGGQNDA